MPIIEVRFIEGVVAPDPAQKRELIERLTEDFIEICGEVTRPFVYCLITETPQMQWGISGVPMPDLQYLTGERRAREIADANRMMSETTADAQAQEQPGGQAQEQERGGPGDSSAGG